MTVAASLFALAFIAVLVAVHVAMVKAAASWSVRQITLLVLGDDAGFKTSMGNKPWYVKYALWLLHHGLV